MKTTTKLMTALCMFTMMGLASCSKESGSDGSTDSTMNTTMETQVDTTATMAADTTMGSDTTAGKTSPDSIPKP